MRSYTRILVVLVLISVGLIIMGCGDDDSDDVAASSTVSPTSTGTSEALHLDPNAPVVAVTLSEWVIAPDVSKMPAGAITFDVTNAGQIPHEIEIFPVADDLKIADIPVAGERAQMASVGSVEVGEIEEDELVAGARIAATFQLEPGRYLLVCNIEGHFESGMVTEFEVE